jgi:NADH-quinone oxidoreductase subunit M
MVQGIQEFFGSHLLSAITFAPLIGALWLYLIPAGRHDSVYRGMAILWSLLTLGLSLLALFAFQSESAALQLVESVDWLPQYGVKYGMAVDGVSLILVLLTTCLMPLVMIASVSVHDKLRGYLAHMLLLESAMIGTLCATDALVFYIFWELMLFPMYFLIGIWGGQRRIYATVKFVLYTVAGSVLLLVGLLYVVYQHADQTGQMTFAIADLIATKFSMQEELWLFAACAIAFGIKVPLFPFHTWLPDAHVEAPTGGSVVLAGVLLKMGLYGFYRIGFPLFPNGAMVFAPYLALLAVIGIIYGALVAWAQGDIKKLVAYSSVSHLGYCVLGFVALNTISMSGSIYQMLNHGVSTGALFLLVGVLYDRKHTRAISEYGGLASKVPVFAFLFLVFTLSSIALPLTNGFVGEFLILNGSFQVFPVLTSVAVLGVILGAVYMLTLYMKTCFGELDEKKNGDLEDVKAHELMTLIPLLIAVFVMGIYPKPIMKLYEPTLKTYISQIEERRGTSIANSESAPKTVALSETKVVKGNKS